MEISTTFLHAEILQRVRSARLQLLSRALLLDLDLSAWLHVPTAPSRLGGYSGVKPSGGAPGCANSLVGQPPESLC